MGDHSAEESGLFHNEEGGGEVSLDGRNSVRVGAHKKEPDHPGRPLVVYKIIAILFSLLNIVCHYLIVTCFSFYYLFWY